RTLAVDARPIRKRCAGEHNRSDEIRPNSTHHHHLPSRLAITDEAGLAFGLRVALSNDLDETRFGAADVLNRLAWHRLGQETDEVAWMARLHSHANLAVMLHAADSRTGPGARIKHDEGTPCRINLVPGGRDDPHQTVVDRPIEAPSVCNKLELEAQDIRRLSSHVLEMIVAALAQHVEEQYGALARINPIVLKLADKIEPRPRQRHPGERATLCPPGFRRANPDILFGRT